MAGKRERKVRSNLPGAIAVLIAALILLTAGSGSGREAVEAIEPWTVGTKLSRETRMPQKALTDTAVPAAAVPGDGPVQESAPVEDTYFEDAVFLGDSRTEGFYLYSGLKTGQYLYSVGATVESVFSKPAWKETDGKVPLLDALADTECGKIYLMLGVNELGWTKIENFHDQYARVIDRIREDHPNAEIVLQSILPVSAMQEAKGTYVNNERIGEYNQIIASLAAEKDCHYMNVAEAVTGADGCLPSYWNFDGIHLNPDGCRVWLHYLRTHSVT